MYCIKCGNEIPNGTKFCPNCGNSIEMEDSILKQGGYIGDNSYEKKHRRTAVICAVAGILVVLAVGMIYILKNAENKANESRTQGKEIVSNVDDGKSETSLPAFKFALNRYVEIQPKEKDNIDVASYLPNKDMVLVYEQVYMEKTTKSDRLLLRKTVTMNYDGDKPAVNYVIEDDQKQALEQATGVGLNGGLSYETAYYDKDKDCLRKDGQGQMAAAYLIPLGKSLDLDEGKIQNADFLFTVTTDSGTYTDCTIAVEEIYHKDGSLFSSTVHYYAKGIGEVLSVIRLGDNADYEVENMLINIETTSEKEIDVAKSPKVDAVDVNNWYHRKCYCGTYNTKNVFFIDERNDNLWARSTYTLICPFYSEKYKTVHDDMGDGYLYTYDFREQRLTGEIVQITYYPAIDTVKLYMTCSVGGGHNYDFSDIYVYDEALSAEINKVLYKEDNQTETATTDDDISSEEMWNDIIYADWLNTDPSPRFRRHGGSREIIFEMVYNEGNLVFVINEEPIALVEKVSRDGNSYHYANEDFTFSVVYNQDTCEIEIDDRYTADDYSGLYVQMPDGDKAGE